MKLENQVASLEPSKKLRQLGVKQESYFFWWPTKSDHVQDHKPEGTVAWCSAFTVAELGEMLMENREYEMPYYRSGEGDWAASGYYDLPEGRGKIAADTEADARANLLIYLLENNLVTL